MVWPELNLMLRLCRLYETRRCNHHNAEFHSSLWSEPNLSPEIKVFKRKIEFMSVNCLNLSNSYIDQNLGWMVDSADLVNDIDAVRDILLDIESPCFIAENGNELGISRQRGTSMALPGNVAAFAPAYGASLLGDQEFRKDHGTKQSYYAGAMANGIASEEMVISLGRAGYLGSFGAGGLVPSHIEDAVLRIQKDLPNGPYAFNLIHSPSEPALERGAVDIYLKYGVPCVEAAAFIALTENIVYYRVAGLKRGADREIIIANRVIAKISRREVAVKFMLPAPEKMALIFRWYLGLASRWANIGEKGREMDYQIWCGPCMGAFNAWTCGTYLEKPENRNVVDVASHLMSGAGYLFRIQFLKSQGIQISPELTRYIPENRIV